jgi:hypothetical protein
MSDSLNPTRDAEQLMFGAIPGKAINGAIRSKHLAWPWLESRSRACNRSAAKDEKELLTPLEK